MGTRLTGGLLPGIALAAAPQPVVQDDIVPSLKLLDEPLSDRPDGGPFSLEVGVLRVVHAVPAVKTVHLLIHGQPDVAVARQSLGDGGLPGAGDAGQENGEGHVVIPFATRVRERGHCL